MIGKQGSGSIKSAFVTDENMKTKPIAGIDMTGIIVIAALLVSGLSLLSSYQQQVLAQVEDLTGGAGGTTAGGTEGATTAGGNATTTVAGGGNQTTVEVMMHLEEVRTAIENGDTEGALMHLDLALMALGGNATSTSGTDANNTSNEDATPTDGGTSAADERSECGGVTVGGTSAADDYGCPPDPDY